MNDAELSPFFAVIALQDGLIDADFGIPLRDSPRCCENARK